MFYKCVIFFKKMIFYYNKAEVCDFTETEIVDRICLNLIQGVTLYL